MRDDRADATLLRQQVQVAVDRVLADMSNAALPGAGAAGVEGGAEQGRGAASRRIRALEAGCGSMSHVRVPQSAHVTGLDISAAQLERNPRIHDKIVGDLQTIDLPPESFDLVVCWNVLEHLRHPDAAVIRLAAAVRPGGALVIACPNPSSLRGLLARLSPQRSHVWFYRRLLGVEGAGADDVGPFPTIMSHRISARALCRVAGSLGFTVELRVMAKANFWWAKRSVVRRAVDTGLDGLALLLRGLTLGRYRGELAQTRLVFRKTAAAA
jgi:SAM-dependent methyltransferase